MRNNNSRKMGLGVGLGFILIVVSILVSFLTSEVGSFYTHLHSFSQSVKDHDRDQSVQNLENLKKNYSNFSAWKLQYFADRWLFNKIYNYEAAVSILNEDFEKAENTDLKNREDDYYVSYLRGVAKFKALHVAYQQAMIRKDKKQMAAIQKLVLEQVKPDFEQCVKQGPGSATNFDCSFNYDLVSDPQSAQKALKSQAPGPKFILGIPSGQGQEPVTGKPAGEKPAQKQSPQLNPAEKLKAGQGNAKKVG